ncbi:hypothetical protein ACVA6G_19295 [Photobacterium damselae]
MTIDTMLKISDDNGTGVFTVSNDLDKSSFIKIEPSKVIVNKDGSLKKIKYDKSNFKDWEISLTKTKLILEPKRVKNIGIRSLCSDGCDRTHDTVFAIKFLPTPYLKGDEKQASVTINYGYEPIFVIPASSPKYKYKIERKDDRVLIENSGNSLLRIFIDQCNEKVKKNCNSNIVVLAGRKKDINLPINSRQNKINLNIMGYDNSFYKKAILGKTTPIIRR